MQKQDSLELLWGENLVVAGLADVTENKKQGRDFLGYVSG
jgi:hypothetical protein